MKNLLSIIAFAFVMMLSVQSISAQSLSQDQDSPEAVAKQKVSDLSNQLDLTGDQQRTLYRAFVAKEVNYSKHVTGKDATSADVIANKNKFDETFMTSMKKTLTDEQYKKWISDLKK